MMQTTIGGAVDSLISWFMGMDTDMMHKVMGARSGGMQLWLNSRGSMEKWKAVFSDTKSFILYESSQLSCATEEYASIAKGPIYSCSIYTVSEDQQGMKPASWG